MENQDIAGLSEFIGAIESAESSDRTLQLLADAAAVLLEAEKVSVVARSESGLLQVRALHWPASDGTDGVAAQVMASGEALLVTDADQDPRLSPYRGPRYSTSSFLCVPISSGGSRVAVLNVTDRKDRESFARGHLQLAQLLTRIAGLNLERHRFEERIEELQKESVTDALTGLGNRRHFEQRVASEMSRARRFSHPLSLILLDIDDFKILNDTKGHPAGDRALKQVSETLLDNVRTIDDVVRYGGEEFAIVLPQTPIDLATVVAERVRTAMHRLDVEGASQQPRGHFSVSLGVSAHPRDARDDTELVNHADIALYMAKADGKDRVAAFEPLKDDERRNHRRIPIRLNSTIEGEDDRGRFEEQATIQNISAGGALFRHRRQLEPRSEVLLSIHSPFTNGGDEPVIIRVDSCLVRSDEGEEGYRAAVAFKEELERFS
ncbi:MAG: diguanylate cyclase [bacterium]